MKPEVKAKWLAALRSGDYQQGRHYLRANNEFCCLGVLCDLVKNEVRVKWNESASPIRLFGTEKSQLPISVADFVSMNGFPMTNEIRQFLLLPTLKKTRD